MRACYQCEYYTKDEIEEDCGLCKITETKQYCCNEPCSHFIEKRDEREEY